MSGHLSRFVLDKLASGELTPEDLTQILLDHLAHVCPECHRALAEAAKGLGLEDSLGSGGLDGAAFCQAFEKDRQLRQKRARELALRLEKAGEKAPQQVMDGAAEDYANPVLAQRLLARGWAACRTRQPAAARTLGLATEAVGHRLGEVARFAELSFDYRLAGLTVAANAARIEDRFETAFQLLEQAEDLVQDVADPALLCDYFRVSGTTQLDAGKLGTAAASFQVAAELATDARDSLRVARVTLKLAALLRATGNTRKSVAVLQDGLRELDSIGASRERAQLTLLAQANLALYLCELGEADAAEEVLRSIDTSLVEKIGQEARLHWIRGLIARLREDYRDAVTEFRQAQRFFEDHGFLLEAGLVVLDTTRTALAAGDQTVLLATIQDLGRLSGEATDDLVASQLYLACVAVQNGTLTLSLIEDLYEKLRSRCR